MKFLILYECASIDWTLLEWRRNDIDAHIIFRPVSKFFRMIRRFWIRSNIPFQHFWYSKKWKKTVAEADVVVVHMSKLVASLPYYINKLNPKAKVVAWYWNSVNISLDPSLIKGKCSIWSFDPADCAKYGMKFNHQYYFKSLIQKNSNIDCDVYYHGGDSGRGKSLIELYNLIVAKNLKCKMKIVHPIYDQIPEEMKSPIIPYAQIVENSSKSRCLLEVLRPYQSGPTLRLMEALFNKKKIITTNKSIKNEPFYREDNMFIIGERSVDELYDFVKSDYVNPGDEFIDEYDVKNWLNNFVE